MAELPFFSSQGSHCDSQSIPFVDQENLASSPLKARSDAAAALRSSILKPKKPPTVTPKRFTKFFTPRNSLSGRGGRQSKSHRTLKDITHNGGNRRSRGLLGGSGVEEDADELSSLRPSKRRKQSLDLSSSPPTSTPLKGVTSAYGETPIFEDFVSSPATVDDEDVLPDLMKHLEPFPTPIRRLRQTGTANRILQRSFGGFETNSRAWRGNDHCGDQRSATANFITSPRDHYSFRGTALPFCSASCNTNPLVAFADEEGSVRLMDTSNNADFFRPHVSFRVHRNAIMDIAFSSDDYLLATASGDQTACVVDMQTQKTMYNLTGHGGSLKQVRFNPTDDKMVTTSSRDGSVQIWDLRCSTRTASQLLRPSAYSNAGSSPQTLYSKHNMNIGPAHRTVGGKITARTPIADENVGVSITAFQHFNNGRSHLLATASEANASIKLWDLRNAGRRGLAVPVSSTSVPEQHKRNFGVSALALSGDGGRLYSVCRDSVVYAYSTNHMALGCVPEMSAEHPGRRAPREGRMGLGPLYGLKHPKLRFATFYVRASLRPAQADKPELLAIGSSDRAPVVMPTDERHLPHRSMRPRLPIPHDDDEENPSLPLLPEELPTPAPIERGPPIYTMGTPLVAAHRKEVTSVSFTSEGNLVSISDDYTARCWREDAATARRLRVYGNVGGQRYGHGWAEVGKDWDEEE